LAHTRTCAISLRDPNTCRCECNGSLHGSAWIPSIQHAPEARHEPPRQTKVRSRQRKVRRIAFTAALTASLAVGGLTITGSFDTPASGASHLSTQVNVDLEGTITTLSSLGFGVRDASKPGVSGFLRSTDCAGSASGLVAKFFTLHPCEQFIAETWTITRQGITTLVAFSWVEMTTTTLAGQYKAVVDIYGTGNPPGASSAFNGLCYASDQQGSTVWTVEVKTTGQAKLDQGILQDAVEGDLSENYLQKHCVN
jgi:hypothetical protein